MLKVENVTKYYGNNLAVDDLSFTINNGEIFGLLGVNGAGKTTTFRMIMSLLEPTKGKITLNGKKVGYDICEHIGFLTEERSLMTKLTVKEQVIYYATLKGMKEKEILAKLDYWLDRFGVSEYKERKIKELSKGNQQKIQFMTAVIHNPELLVLDEPFSGLDPVNTELLKNIIINLVKEGKYIIMSAHQMSTIEEFCSDILILNKGKTVIKGNLKEIKDTYPANRVQIETNENIETDIKKLGFEIENIKNYSYTVKIFDEQKAHELLKELVIKGITINKFEIMKPTLNDIFIEKVGE